MKGFYTKTARVGLLRACLRYIEDPNRSLWSRIVLALSPLLLLWVISPLDLVPEIILGPLGLADDGAILIAITLLVKLALSFYGEQRYVQPQRKQVESTVDQRNAN